MSIENIIEKFDGLATVTVGVLVTKMLIEYFKKKLNHEADKEDNINAILTKQLETLVENSVNYKNDINDLKRLILNKSNMLFSGDELLSREILSIFSIFFSNLVSILIMSYTSLKTNRAVTIVVSIFFVLASILSSKMGWMGYLFPNAYISLSSVSAFTSLAAMCLLSMVYITVFYILSYKKFKKMEF